MADSATSVVEIIQGGFARMPAAIFAGLFLALVAIGLKASLAGWRSTHILLLVARTPALDVGSDRGAAIGRIVKIHGAAESAQPADLDPVLWQHSVRSTGKSSRTRLTKAVPIVVHTAAGPCLVDARRAEVVPSRSDTDHAMFDRDRYTVDKAILRGDEVFAIGRLGSPSAADRAGSASSGASTSTCELRRTWGLMLLSGASERNVSVLYAMWLAVQLPLAALCLLLAVWGARIHLSTYPTTPPGTRASFFEALRSIPLENDPGVEMEMRRDRSGQPRLP